MQVNARNHRAIGRGRRLALAAERVVRAAGSSGTTGEGPGAPNEPVDLKAAGVAVEEAWAEGRAVAVDDARLVLSKYSAEPESGQF